MIPRLYAAGTTTFTTEGLGALTDCISCETNTGINGIPELNISYPMTGSHADEIGERCVIVADRDRNTKAQPYIVKTIDKSTPGIIAIYAVHLAVDLIDGVGLEPYTAASLQTAVAGLSTYATSALPITITTQVVSNSEFNHAIPSSVKLAMGGMEGSILDTYGGEWDFVGLTATLKSSLGSNNGVVVRNGKNLVSLEMNTDWTGVYTAIYPYWLDPDTAAVTQMASPLYSLGTFSFVKVLTLDLSDQFETAPSDADLLAAAQSYAASRTLTSPAVSWNVVMAELRAAPEYQSVALLEEVSLGDTITIYYPAFSVNASARVVNERFDVLREQYVELTIGSVKANLASTIADQASALKTAVKTVQGAVADAIQRATQLITGNAGGYVVTVLNAAGEPQELLVMDTDDITTATNIWRWNVSGLGFSSNGYAGPYSTAITSDGKIVADFITAGTLNGSVIEAGTVYFSQLADDTKAYIVGEVDGLRTEVTQDIDDINTTLSSQITQNATNIDLRFSQIEQIIEDGDDANNAAISSLSSHIVIGANSMRFLVDGSEYELEITNTGIQITGAGGTAVATFTANGVLLPQETIVPLGGTLTLGNFRWTPRSSGNLSMVYIG